MNLAELTTLRLGGPAGQILEAADEQRLVDAVAIADQAGDPALIVAGGSNLVIADEGFPGTVILVRSRGISVDADACSGAMVTVQAGENWDDFVAHAIGQGWVGIEALSGVPGSVGATPIQNVGAYGQDVSQTIASVRTYDRVESKIRTFAAADCGFSYRHSRFKAEPRRYVVLSVTYQFALGDLSAPVAYAELARTLGVEVGERAPAAAVRDAVLGLRSGKGMVLDADDHDTWSAGSFFTNPILSPELAASLPADAPRYYQPDGTVKTSAAWLIERAGFARGYGDGPAKLSTKHTLALTNRGGATTEDLLDLARKIRTAVEAEFGITLVNEPVLVRCDL
ncbi:MAG: UDP-N-acetylmuramate dehydrogenase [Kineosporiaceae bacterium]|nr:UDP-N-acetylmuramate dehydrogenase [Aeromicrobium sp.]